ncbi:MAG: CoA transferase [Proteobacteria bacterium]|jgi:2-methylfumaryl-CoA isomerase|nr:CoA transferase [Pseudomonadales bacterium]MDA0805888.1 CoA transferase [Pseudomonadota bacterium]MDA0896480.1 CoA transferase [Pseudomonadota bacterium]MDA1243921.1 CoA transferase [Pseudomonadota bacterium]
MQNLLKGLRIVEGSAFIAAPSGGMTLGQLGADVIRFDQIGGGIDYRRWPITEKGKSLYWHSLNKGKRSIAVDFRKPEGRELLTRLICAPGDDGGLFLTNFPARGWLAYDALKHGREDLIYLNLTGDRHGGSALDYTVNARVGVPFLNGDGITPLNSALPAWDVIAGQQIALGLLAAERHRSRTGEGQMITLALADVALATMGHLGYLAEAQLNENQRPAMGNHIFGTFGHDFVCADGERVMIVGVSPNQWQAIVKVTDCASSVATLAFELGLNFDKEGDRYAARERLRSLFAPWFAARSSKQVHVALEAAGVCWGPYQTVKQLVENDAECSTENPLFSSINQPDIGRLLTPSQPLNFAGLESIEPKPAPRLGQHTDEILSELLEMSSGEIAALHDAKIVAAASS